MTESIGAVLWVLVFYPVWSPRMRRIRSRGKVSGNTVMTGTGRAWQQDELMDELFDDNGKDEW